jgi:LPS O-antigen subunit length determinant protein (WzzB/FepE family)
MQKAETAHVPMKPRRAALFALGWTLVLGGIVGCFYRSCRELFSYRPALLCSVLNRYGSDER